MYLFSRYPGILKKFSYFPRTLFSNFRKLNFITFNPTQYIIEIWIRIVKVLSMSKRSDSPNRDGRRTV